MTNTSGNGAPEHLIEVKDLYKHFKVTVGGTIKRQLATLKAVDGVSFAVKEGETLGLVGESGCGKSTTARLMLRLIEASSGEVHFEGQEILSLSKSRFRPLRQQMQIVFQDPFASLDPRMMVRDIVGEGLKVWKSTDDYDGEVGDLLQRVGLDATHARRYPHEFSGGQRQRIGIARALAVKPKLLVTDEPVSALDVSVQAQILNLLDDLQQEFGLTIIFIAHDLSVVRHISDRVAVMYLGKIVEIGTREQVYEHPQHPYTNALLSAVPAPDPEHERNRQRIEVEGDPPSPLDPPSGCRFRTRCWKATDLCAQEEPELVVRTGTHPVACHYPE